MLTGVVLLGICSYEQVQVTKGIIHIRDVSLVLLFIGYEGYCPEFPLRRSDRFTTEAYLGILVPVLVAVHCRKPIDFLNERVQSIVIVILIFGSAVLYGKLGKSAENLVLFIFVEVALVERM